jgi:hypothetical protein
MLANDLAHYYLIVEVGNRCRSDIFNISTGHAQAFNEVARAVV